MTNHEENINNLNRLTEENIKTIFKQGETIEKMRNTNEILLDKADKHDKGLLKVQNELLKFNDVEKNIRENSNRIDENFKNLADYQYYCNKKFADVDNNILNFIETLNEINRQLEKKGNGNVNMSNLIAASQSNAENSQAQLMSEMSKSAKEIENLKKVFREYNEKMDKMSKSNISLEEQVKELKKETSSLTANGAGRNMSSSNSLTGTGKGKEANLNSDGNKFFDENIPGNEMQMETDSIRNNIEMLFDRMKKFQDYFKTVTTNLGQKTEKSDFEKLSRMVDAEFEKLNKKISDSNLNSEARLRSFSQNRKNTESSQIGADNEASESKKHKKKTSTANNKNENNSNTNNENNSNNLTNTEGFEFDENLVNMTKALIEREVSSKEEFVKMLEFMEEFKSERISSKEEIDKLYESIVEIRSGLSAAGQWEEKALALQDQISDVNFVLKKQSSAFEERFKNLEGDPATDDTNQNTENFGGSIKDNIKNLTNSVKTIIDKIDKVTLRQDNMNSEILAKVKKDLSAESAKILSDFKVDLKHSITLIEEKLREKVDKFSLDEFGKYVNERLSNEINKKLDRSDLKRNNNLINKKIDTLENKISKTLVDTLIDLQMEEAPLIVKKPFGAQAREKCASCNQVVLNSIINEEGFNDEINNGSSHNKHNMTVMPQKFKFKNVQESCYKFGAGSYSRYLSSIDNVNDDLRYNKSVHLPEINSNKNNNRKLNYGGNNNNNINNHIGGGISVNNSSVNNNSNINSNYSNEPKLKNRILEEFTEKAFNTMINEELEKKMINPENLIKTANKLYETVEKEKKIFINSNNFLNK